MSTALATLPAPLQQALAERGIDAAQWSTLTNSLYPGARPESALMVLDYCRARKLDPMKKPCHIVPMKVKDARTGAYDWRDVVMPGIYEYRTTAMRTGQYMGHSAPEYGPDKAHAGVTAPEWCEMTMYRVGPDGQRIEFPVRVYFREAVVLNKEGKANDRWNKAPIQMLTKCAEAAGLREAFPDEFGGEATADEMEGREMGGSAIDVTPVTVPMPQPTGQAALGAPATSQPEPPPTEEPAKPTVPATPGTAFRRDAVRITHMEPRTGKPKVNAQTGEETPGAPFAIVTLSTGEKFQSWHRNLNASLEAWWHAKTLVDVDAKTSTKGAEFMPSIEKAAAVQG